MRETNKTTKPGWVVCAWRGKSPIARLRTYGVRDHGIALGYVERLRAAAAPGISYSIEDENNVPADVPAVEESHVALR